MTVSSQPYSLATWKCASTKKSIQLLIKMNRLEFILYSTTGGGTSVSHLHFFHHSDVYIHIDTIYMYSVIILGHVKKSMFQYTFIYFIQRNLTYS